METALTDREYWIDSYRSDEFVEYEADNDHFRLLFRFVQPQMIRTVIEIGSYPAPFLAALGQFGCELNGVDFHPDNATRVPAWLKSRGHRVGEFVSEDFLAFHSERRYDLVYSIGFIEHFTDFPEVILRHARLVRSGGHLFLTTPNFRGWIQKWLHHLLDRENLEKHFLPAMNPRAWKEILEREGFTVLYAGYYGNIGFWVDPIAKRSRFNRLCATAIVHLFWNIRKLYKGDSPHLSVFCGLVAVRNAA